MAVEILNRVLICPCEPRGSKVGASAKPREAQRIPTLSPTYEDALSATQVCSIDFLADRQCSTKRECL